MDVVVKTANTSIMRKAGFILLLFIAIFSVKAKAQDNVAQNYKMALGVRLSSSAPVINNSISFKYFYKENTAVEALFSFGDPVGLGALIEKHNPITSQAFTWFYGGGVYLGFGGGRNVGGQGVLGLDYKFPTIPINFSLDWKPELNFAKEFSFEPAAVGLSARFTFK
jgi:hypothetical protein